MELESLISVSFSEEELKEALLKELEFRMNDFVVGTEEYKKRKKIISHIRSETCSLDWVNGKFTLSADGVASVEKF